MSDRVTPATGDFLSTAYYAHGGLRDHARKMEFVAEDAEEEADAPPEPAPARKGSVIDLIV